MAQFQKGSPNDILRVLAIMFGFIGAEDFNPVCVFALSGVRATIAEMVKKNTITPAQEEIIFETAKNAGLCADMDEVLEKILSFSMPDDFIPTWTIEWGYHGDEGGDENEDDGEDGDERNASMYAILVNESKDMDLECGYVEDIFSVYHACNELLEGDLMDIYEAARILKMVIIKLRHPQNQQPTTSIESTGSN